MSENIYTNIQSDSKENIEQKIIDLTNRIDELEDIITKLYKKVTYLSNENTLHHGVYR